MATLTLDANFRSITGRKVRHLRAAGLVPVIIYGREHQPENAQVNALAFERVLRDGGNSQLVKVDLDGQERNVLVREIQRHPVRHNLLHADFYAVSMTEIQQVSVPLVAVGTPSTSSSEVIMMQTMDSVEIEALPADIPPSIGVEVSSLEGPESQPVTVADLPTLPGVTYLSDPEEPIFSLILSRAAVSQEDEDAEAEQALLGEDREPEVIGRGRDDAEG